MAAAMLGKRTWAFPLVVVGANFIFMYVIAHLWEEFLLRNLKAHLGPEFWQHFPGPRAPFVAGLAVLGLLWLSCWWLWRRRPFIRV